MRFEELASRAGKTAAYVGRQTDRPALSAIIAHHHRRMLIARWSTAAAAILVAFGIVWLWPASGVPLAASNSTTTTQAEGTTTEALAGDREICPITLPGRAPFAPPETRDLTLSFEGVVWYGTPELWTFVQEEGPVWVGLPVNSDGSLTQKTFWWTDDYVSSIEPVPDITFTAENVGGSAPTVGADAVTSGGQAEMGVFIIAGFEIPQDGCWRITARYRDVSVSYVAWAEGR